MEQNETYVVVSAVYVLTVAVAIGASVCGLYQIRRRTGSKMADVLVALVPVAVIGTFWVLLLSIYSVVVSSVNRRHHQMLMPYVNAMLLVTSLFFLILLVFAANPFKQVAFVPPDGQGLLRPEQDWGPSPVRVLDAFAERTPFGDQVRRIISWWAAYEALHVGIEKAGIEGVSAQIQREPGAPPIPLFRLRPTRSKAQRLSGVSPLVQSGRVRFATRLDPRSNPGLTVTGSVVGELPQFPVAKHDDLADAFVYALLLLMRWEAVTQRERDAVDHAVGVRVLGAPKL